MGGGRRCGGQRRQKLWSKVLPNSFQEPLKPGEKTEHNLKLSLEQLFTGTTKRLKVRSTFPEPYFIVEIISNSSQTPYPYFRSIEKDEHPTVNIFLKKKF